MKSLEKNGLGNQVSTFREFYKNIDLTDIKEVSMEISKNQLHKAGIDAVISELKEIWDSLPFTQFAGLPNARIYRPPEKPGS